MCVLYFVVFEGFTNQKGALPLPLAARPDFWLRPMRAPLTPIGGGGVLSNVPEPTKTGGPFFSMATGHLSYLLPELMDLKLFGKSILLARKKLGPFLAHPLRSELTSELPLLDIKD